MCNICAEFRPFDPDCPYGGHPSISPVDDRLTQIEALGLEIADAEALFGNAEPDLPFDPYEGIGFPEADPMAFGPFNDIPGNGLTQVELSPGMRLNADIGFAGDTDWFRMNLVQGQSYEISMAALPIDGLGDPLLQLYDNTGSFLTFNDNKFQSLDSVLAFTATRTGLYFVEATGFGGGGSGTGSYQIALNAVNYSADTVGNIPRESAPGAVNTPILGTVDFVDDEDMFAVELEAGMSYYAVLDAFGDNGNPLGDPFLQLKTEGLSVLAENDDNGITRNSFISFEQLAVAAAIVMRVGKAQTVTELMHEVGIAIGAGLQQPAGFVRPEDWVGVEPPLALKLAKGRVWWPHLARQATVEKSLAQNEIGFRTG